MSLFISQNISGSIFLQLTEQDLEKGSFNCLTFGGRKQIVHALNKLKAEQAHLVIQLSRGDFEIGKVLGKGVFGTVFSATYLPYHNGRFAIKKLYEPESQVSFMQELKILKDLRHKHIVKLIGYCCDKDGTFLMMEMMDISLKRLMIKLKKESSHSWWSNDEIIQYVTQLLSALEYLHSNKVAHRDIKVLF